MRKIFSPVRANLLGGWTDQELWPEMAAVSNVSIGWSGCFGGQYPLMMNETGKLKSKIKGQGTGLGISSIMLALEIIQKNPKIINNDLIGVILKVLEIERDISKGGWQDQVGGIVGGLKLTITNDHRDFHIRSKPFHPALEHMVLFDSGVRRRSAGIGDRIRELIEANDSAFFDHMRWISYLAIKTFDDNKAEPLIEKTLISWKKFVEFVPQMEIPIKLPKIGKKRAYGSYLLGAGAGGFGITWVTNPGYRFEVVDIYRKAGIWAEIPLVINSGPLIVAGKK